MKRYISVITAVLLVVLMMFSMSACQKKSEAELYDMGLKVVDTMAEMANSDDYAQIIDSSIAIRDRNIIVTEDYKTPSAVYLIEEPDTEDMLAAMGSYDESLWENLSDNLRDQLKNRVSFSSIVTAINGNRGTTELTLSALYFSKTRFKSLSIDNTVIYLYMFEKGTPIVVIFSEDGYATGQFVFTDDVADFERLKCTVNKIK